MVNFQKPTEMRARWLVLALCCLMMVGNYYSYDTPAALQAQLKNTMGSKNFQSNFSLLYTVYSIPNMVLPFFAGIFVDRLGAGRCLILFSILLFAGQALFAFGESVQSWWIMYIGRTVFGLGGENMSVANSAYLTEWFGGSELAFAFGVNLSVSRLGSVINNFLTPKIASMVGTSFSLWVAAFLCIGSVAISCVLYGMAKMAVKTSEADAEIREQLLAEDSQEPHLEHSTSTSTSKHESMDIEEPSQSLPRTVSTMAPVVDIDAEADLERVECSDIKHMGVMFWLLTFSCLVVYGCVLPFNNILQGLLLERDFFKEPSDDCVLLYPSNCTSGILAPLPNPSTRMNGSIACPGANHAPVMPTALNERCPADMTCMKELYSYEVLTPDDINCADEFWKEACVSNYCDALETATINAGPVMSIPFILSAVLSPLLGLLIDRIGNRAVLATVAPCMLILVHTLIGFTSVMPEVPLVGQGIAYSLFAAVLWPSVPFAVPAKAVGTAYGLITAIQNTGLAGFPPMIAAIYTSSDNHYVPNVQLFFICCALVGVCIGVLLNVYDAKTGGKLNATTKKT